MWIDDNLEDKTHLSPGGAGRTSRATTSHIIAHRIRYGASGDPSTWIDQIAAFFTVDPEGVAVISLGGSYRSKLPTINRWREEGIPAAIVARAFVAYHLIVDPLGAVHQMLPLDAKGAHAYPNSTALGVAFIGDFLAPDELAAWERRVPGAHGGDELTAAQENSGRKLFRDLLVRYPAAGILTHDESLEERGKSPKGCPGALAVPFVQGARSWATVAARSIREGSARR